MTQSEIRRRWQAASANLSKHWSQFDHIEILDNSGSELRLVHVSTVERSVRSKNTPAWVNDILNNRPKQIRTAETTETAQRLATSLSETDRGIEL